MPGLTFAVIMSALALFVPAIAIAGLAIDAGTDRPSLAGRPGENRPRPRPGPALTVELPQTWTLAHAGLTGPSAWLTAPRETEDFAARRAAIAAAYDKADRKAAAAARRAGMTKKAGWTCA